MDNEKLLKKMKEELNKIDWKRPVNENRDKVNEIYEKLLIQ